MAKFVYYLDTREDKKDKAGRCPLRIRISANYTQAIISTPYRLAKEDWDEKNDRIRKSCEYYKAEKENPRILMYLNEIITFAYSIQNYESLSAAEIKRRYLARNGSKENCPFCELLETFANNKKKENPTSDFYKCIVATKNSLQAFSQDVRINEITPQFLKDYELHLREKLKPNSIADYMTNIRSTYNYAISVGLAKRENYPFTNYKIRREQTRHRVIAIDDIGKIFSYTPESNSEALALDLFKLSFYLIGINFKDMLYLEWEDIYNDRIVYRRLKTGRDITVKIEPEAYEIINRHKGEKRLLNILEIKEKKANENRSSQIHTDVTKICNKYLKKIFEKLEINIPVSTYYARHTWATTARKIGIDYDIIHLALGHSNGDVTAVYIEYDNEEIDEANRLVIDAIKK